MKGEREKGKRRRAEGLVGKGEMKTRLAGSREPANLRKVVRLNERAEISVRCCGILTVSVTEKCRNAARLNDRLWRYPAPPLYPRPDGRSSGRRWSGREGRR